MEHLLDLICKRIGSPVGRRQALTLLCAAFGRAMLTGVGVRSALAATSCGGDSDCEFWEWCNTDIGSCAPKLANGGNIPLTMRFFGFCSPIAGAVACISGVCDSSDNACGYAGNSGPCTQGTGSTVCRSGRCSANSTCEVVSGCNVDADCGTGLWCYETAHVCYMRLANGSPIPLDGNHLNGTCTTGVGALVCASGVCDADFSCGYAAGHICGNSSVCRSGLCDGGRCVPTGGCVLDADCSPGFWCNESSLTCTATLNNGSPLPVDLVHTNPTLNGTCSSSAAMLVCSSGVCGSDNLCGYPIGVHCTTGTMCRSGYCNASTSTCGQPLGPPAQDVYVLNPGSGTVSVMDTSSNTIITTIPVGKSPAHLVITPDGAKVYVANAASNSVSVISTATNTVTTTVPVGSSPSYLGVHPDGSKVYVANTGGNSVSVILTASDTVTATIPVGKTPERLAVSGDGSAVYVTNALSNSVSIIATSSNTVTGTATVGSVPTNVVIH